MPDSSVYRPRYPRSSPLWLCLWNHFFLFLQNYVRKQQEKYGYLRPIIEEVINKFLECGDLSKGFARIRCPQCQHEMLLPFSCKSRWFCPSCHQKKTQLFADFVCDEQGCPTFGQVLHKQMPRAGNIGRSWRREKQVGDAVRPHRVEGLYRV